MAFMNSRTASACCDIATAARAPEGILGRVELQSLLPRAVVIRAGHDGHQHPDGE